MQKHNKPIALLSCLRLLATLEAISAPTNRRINMYKKHNRPITLLPCSRLLATLEAISALTNTQTCMYKKHNRPITLLSCSRLLAQVQKKTWPLTHPRPARRARPAHCLGKRLGNALQVGGQAGASSGPQLIRVHLRIQGESNINGATLLQASVAVSETRRSTRVVVW